MDDDDEEEDLKDKFYNEFDQHDQFNELSIDTPDLDETPFPFYMQQLFPDKKKNANIDHGDEDRGNWDSQFEYLLSCMGSVIGLGNVYRFPSKVYNGGGGAFLLPYLLMGLMLAFPIMMLEVSLGQFCGLSSSKAFKCVPPLFALGWILILIAFLIVISYATIIAWCLVYMFCSFQAVLPWSVCTNSYNTPACINTSSGIHNLTNTSFEPSSIQFWNYYLTGHKRHDGSYFKITDSFGMPKVHTAICSFIVLSLSALMIMFGVKVSGKIIYLTVIFPYIAILQFIILGCSLPGALKGIKFYLYPEPKKLLDPLVLLSALEQLLYSSSIATGCLITLSSYNRFRDKILRNVFIIVLADILTSFISGFATFPVLGYMSYRSGIEIKDLLPSDSSLFFITYPEALSTLSNSNLWCILFMIMAVMLGVDSLFVLLETIITGIADQWPKLHVRKFKIILTTSVCGICLVTSVAFSTPAGSNWIALFDNRISTYLIPFAAMMEVVVVFWMYGRRNCFSDYEMMTGYKINIHVATVLLTIAPTLILIVMLFGAITAGPIVVHGHKYPQWTQTLAWSLVILFLSPLPIGACFVFIKIKIENPGLGLKEYFKMCINPNVSWGPKLKRYWVTSDFYSKKLLKHKSDPKLLLALSKHEKIEKLIYKSERMIKKVGNL